MWAFIELGRVVERTTEERAPAALASLELSPPGRADRRRRTGAPRRRERERARAEVAAGIRVATLPGSRRSWPDCGTRLPERGRARRHRACGGRPQPQPRRARPGWSLTGSRPPGAKEALLSRLSTAVIGAQRLVTPGIARPGCTARAWRRAGAAGSGSGEDLARAVAGSVPLQKAQLEVAAMNDNLLKAADAPSPADLPLLVVPARSARSTRSRLWRPTSTPRSAARFLDRVRELDALVEGPDSIPAARGARARRARPRRTPPGRERDPVARPDRGGRPACRCREGGHRRCRRRGARRAQRSAPACWPRSCCASLLELGADRLALRRPQPA